MSDFLAMGGYAWYVWGSYGVTFACLAIEVLLLDEGAVKPRHKRILAIVGGLARSASATALVLTAFQRTWCSSSRPRRSRRTRRRRAHLPHRRHGGEGSVKRDGHRGALRRHRHREEHPGGLQRRAARPLPRGQGRRRAGPARRRRRVPRARGARQARRELHAARGRARGGKGAENRTCRDQSNDPRTRTTRAVPRAGACAGAGIAFRFGNPGAPPRWMRAPAAAQAQALLVAFAFGCLDLRVRHQRLSRCSTSRCNSNSALPLHYRFAGVWGGHEGSLLLWCLMLGAWMLAVAAFSAHLPERWWRACSA